MLAIIWCRIFSLPACYPKNLKIKIYITIILAVVLYGCEMWSLTLREEHLLRVFLNRMLRRIIGPKGDEVIIIIIFIFHLSIYKYNPRDVEIVECTILLNYSSHVQSC